MLEVPFPNSDQRNTQQGKKKSFTSAEGYKHRSWSDRQSTLYRKSAQFSSNNTVLKGQMT
jgi:hypothetical protein